MAWQPGTRDRPPSAAGAKASALGLPFSQGDAPRDYTLPLAARFAPHNGPKAWAALVSFTLGAFIICGVVPSLLHVGSIRIFAALFGVTLFVVRAISRNAVTTAEPSAQRALGRDCAYCRYARDSAMPGPPAATP